MPATLTIKEFWYGLILAAVIAVGLWVYHGGEEHVEVKDAKATAVAVQKVQTAENTAETTETQSAIIYEKAVAIPLVADLGVECVRVPQRRVSLPSTSASPAAATGNGQTDSVLGPAYDPTGAILDRALAADDQIEYLQRRVKELEDLMKASP